MNSIIPKQKEVKRILITGAVGNIGYSLSFMIAEGLMLGSNFQIILHLFDLPRMENALKGLEMELNDCAFPLLGGIVASSDPKVAFADIDIAVFCGAMPRGPGMERKDLLKANSIIFKEQGKYLDSYAKKSVKVCVVGNPANTNAYVLSNNAPSISKNNFSALTRLDHNRAMGQISAKLNVSVENIAGVTIWGNHSSTQYPDVENAVVCLNGTDKDALSDLIKDTDWIQNTFIKNVQKRGAEIIEARKLSSAASAAKAICDHFKDWVLGTKEGNWTSMAVFSNGEYESAKDVLFSFPVTCKEGTWEIVQNLKISNFGKEKIRISSEELIKEKQMALDE